LIRWEALNSANKVYPSLSGSCRTAAGVRPKGKAFSSFELWHEVPGVGHLASGVKQKILSDFELG